jgi:hypothetical protein
MSVFAYLSETIKEIVTANAARIVLANPVFACVRSAAWSAR